MLALFLRFLEIPVSGCSMVGSVGFTQYDVIVRTRSESSGTRGVDAHPMPNSGSSKPTLWRTSTIPKYPRRAANANMLRYQHARKPKTGV